MWIEFEYNNKKYKVRIEKDKCFFKNKYYINIECNIGYIKSIKAYQVYRYREEFNKDDYIFNKVDKFYYIINKNKYNLHNLINIPYEDYKSSLIDKAIQIINSNDINKNTYDYYPRIFEI